MALRMAVTSGSDPAGALRAALSNRAMNLCWASADWSSPALANSAPVSEAISNNWRL